MGITCGSHFAQMGKIMFESLKLTTREFHKENTIVEVGGVRIGGDEPVIIAGPCAVESYEQMIKTALAARKAGAKLLRGGAYKPRTSPYDFQGLGEDGLKILSKVKKESGMPVISEILEISDLPLFEDIDILQVGSRNMQNTALLKALGRQDKPVLLKNGVASSYEEWLAGAEYIMGEGNSKVILCERGIRTFETYTRNTLDIAAVPIMKNLSHLPIIVDPSHGTGLRELVKPMTSAALAAGADGIMLEVHCNPEEALSDGVQSLDISEFEELMSKVRR